MTCYLIGYKDPEKNGGHEDPMFQEFTYGDINGNGNKLQGVERGDYIFFHKSIYDKRYITAYYYVEEVHLVRSILTDELIMNKYKNPHLEKNIEELNSQETIVFGNPIRSKMLEVPFELTEEVLQKLSRPANLNPNQAQLAAMSSALRTWKQLSDRDVRFLLEQIYKNEDKGRLTNTTLSTEEVFQVLERDIETYIASNPEQIQQGFILEARQLKFSNGKRLDLLLKNDATNERLVVEIKKGLIGRETKSQIKEYMKLCKNEVQGCDQIKGVIVGAGILPAFEQELVNAQKENINVKTYGWKMVFT